MVSSVLNTGEAELGLNPKVGVAAFNISTERELSLMPLIVTVIPWLDPAAPEENTLLMQVKDVI